MTMKTSMKSQGCGELRKENIGQTITVACSVSHLNKDDTT